MLKRRVKAQKHIMFWKINIALAMFMGFFFCSQILAAVQVTSLLWSRYFAAKEMVSFDDFAGKAWVSNLYDQAMEIVKNKDFSPMYDAMDATLKEINAFDCGFTSNDVSNIVLSTNADAYSLLKHIANQAKAGALFIPSQDFAKSCEKLRVCMNMSLNRDFLNKACPDKINEMFVKSWDSLWSFAKLSDENIGSNYFQNGTLDDSDYDLMLDIQALGEIMFDGFKPPVEVLFYKMPKRSDRAKLNGVDYSEFVDNGIDPMSLGTDVVWSDGQMDRYSNGGQWWENGFQCPAPGTTGDRIPFVWDNDAWVGFSGGVDFDISAFITDMQRESPFAYEVPNVGVIGNMCATFQKCGNDIVEWSEQCDEGDTDTNDGCGSTCMFEFCGDGIVQEGEFCDDGNPYNTDACLTGCVYNSCWDGYVFLWQEECDSWDGCNEECKLDNSLCGNGIVDELYGETCDDGNNIDTDVCTNSCKKATCGDNIVREWHEDCDYAEFDEDDGCSMKCEDESGPHCGDEIVQEELGEFCDDGDYDNMDDCLNTCVKASCGDGYLRSGSNEQCDDGNNRDYDCCDFECQAEESVSAEEVALAGMLNAIDSLDEGDSEFDEVVNCAKSCLDLPLSDKILCIAECACWTSASDETWATEAEAFRIRFCTIPAEPVEVTRGKRVFSLEEIFGELYKILQSLKDSGNMPKSVETKEMLDSTMKKNSIVEMLSLNLVVNQKPLFFGTPSNAKLKAKAVKKNEDMMNALLWMSKEKSLVDRNKYVMIADIASINALKWNFSDYDSLQDEIDAAQSELSEKTSLSQDPLVLAKLQKVGMMNTEVMWFLYTNLEFWKSVELLFHDMVWASVLLSEKVKNAK